MKIPKLRFKEFTENKSGYLTSSFQTNQTYRKFFLLSVS